MVTDIPLSAIADIKIAIYLHMKTFSVHTLKYSAIWDGAKSETAISIDLVDNGANADIDGLCKMLKKCGSYLLKNDYVQKITVCCDRPQHPKDVELVF